MAIHCLFLFSVHYRGSRSGESIQTNTLVSRSWQVNKRTDWWLTSTPAFSQAWIRAEPCSIITDLPSTKTSISSFLLEVAENARASWCNVCECGSFSMSTEWISVRCTSTVQKSRRSTCNASFVDDAQHDEMEWSGECKESLKKYEWKCGPLDERLSRCAVWPRAGQGINEKTNLKHSAVTLPVNYSSFYFRRNYRRSVHPDPTFFR